MPNNNLNHFILHRQAAEKSTRPLLTVIGIVTWLQWMQFSCGYVIPNLDQRLSLKLHVHRSDFSFRWLAWTYPLSTSSLYPSALRTFKINSISLLMILCVVYHQWSKIVLTIIDRRPQLSPHCCYDRWERYVYLASLAHSSSYLFFSSVIRHCLRSLSQEVAPRL
jgi:hypothetical protein